MNRIERIITATLSGLSPHRSGSAQQGRLPLIIVPRVLALLLAGFTMRSAMGGPAAAASDVGAKPAIEAGANELLKRMGDFLGQAQSFSVNAEIWQDVTLSSGQRVQAGRTVVLQVRRPDRFHAEVRSPVAIGVCSTTASRLRWSTARRIFMGASRLRLRSTKRWIWPLTGLASPCRWKIWSSAIRIGM